MAYIEPCSADQASFSQTVDDFAPSQPSACQEPPFPPCLSARIDDPVYSAVQLQDAVAARNIGLGLRDAMRAKFMAHARGSKIATRKPKIAAALKSVSPIRTKAARARRSPTAHGGTRKAADDGSGGGSSQGDGEPPHYPRSRQFKVLEARI